MSTLTARLTNQVNHSRARMTLRQLFDQPDDPLKWVVEGLIAEKSLNLLSAAPKVGKSTAARCLAYQVATGGLFLGRQCKPGPVIYVALEDRSQDIREHFRTLGATGNEPVEFIFPERGLNIRAVVRDSATEVHPELIVIDTLQRLIDATDLNDYAETTRLMTSLLDLAKEAAVLCVHHGNKTASTGVSGVLGSTAITGSVANVFYLRKTDHYRLFSSDQRIGDSLEEITVQFDTTTGAVTAGPSKRTAEIHAAADELIAAMEPGHRYTRPDLADLISCRKQTITAAVRALVDSVRLLRTGTGKKGDPYVYERSVSGSVVPPIGREPPFTHS